jgi:hypothetical protein
MFNEIGKALASLSPTTRALEEVHRQARRYLVPGARPHHAAGGRAAGDSRSAQPLPEGFPLPRDVIALVMAGAIRRELLGPSRSKLPKGTPVPFVVAAGRGRAVVPRKVVLWLGNGDAGIGELVLERLVDSIRTRRQAGRPNR